MEEVVIMDATGSTDRRKVVIDLFNDSRSSDATGGSGSSIPLAKVEAAPLDISEKELNWLCRKKMALGVISWTCVALRGSEALKGIKAIKATRG